MTAAEQAAFAAVVAPLKPWDEEGHVWAVAIQGGLLVDAPSIDTDWEEIRLFKGPSLGSWTLWCSHSADDPFGATVYCGLIPDRPTFCRLVEIVHGVRDRARLILDVEPTPSSILPDQVHQDNQRPPD